MPCQPYWGTPTALHHGMVRGLEPRVIFADVTDRADFVSFGLSNSGVAPCAGAWFEPHA